MKITYENTNICKAMSVNDSIKISKYGANIVSLKEVEVVNQLTITQYCGNSLKRHNVV